MALNWILFFQWLLQYQNGDILRTLRTTTRGRHSSALCLSVIECVWPRSQWPANGLSKFQGNFFNDSKGDNWGDILGLCF